MPTRFYLPSTGAAPVSPAFGAWTITTGADRLTMSTAKISSAMTNKTYPAAVSANDRLLARQYVSAPIAAQTVSGTVKSQARALEGGGASTVADSIRVAIYSNDGATLRGTSLALGNAVNTNFSTGVLTNKKFADGDALTAVVASEGDRIVVEFGGQDTGGVSTGGNLNFGDNSGTDLPEDELATAADNPWIEFSGTITFSAPVGAIILSDIPTTFRY